MTLQSVLFIVSMALILGGMFIPLAMTIAMVFLTAFGMKPDKDEPGVVGIAWCSIVIAAGIELNIGLCAWMMVLQ